ncbi:hypothetical protein AVEN_45897-1 [Araneus ventricosus]|uniref:Uncharacterized protein n=1 Tax=Araneus ventricosus TaxID=182803 RepID=A0A4Y2EB64_ARAVE|nr:hypothetical protein AVEN_45897-1 [Araneus ventricosus]
MTRTTPELSLPLQNSAPHQRVDVWLLTYDLTCNKPTYTADFQWCEDSWTAVKIGLAKVATWTVGKLHKGVFVQRAFFHSISSDTWHTKPFWNSQLRRSDRCPFSVELRRDYP